VGTSDCIADNAQLWYRRTEKHSTLFMTPANQNKLQGIIIHSQTRKAVADVYKFMKKAADAGAPINLKKTHRKY
jgi:hypothetical protein